MSGELVMERFRLLERIGSGGMGVVHRAFDERLQRHVAVKEIPVADPERVLREAQAAARLNHPGIVTVYELGERGGRALLVSELVPGDTLRTLRSSGELSDRDVAEIGVDLCEALAHAHAHGVVHRDIKPENVIVRDDDGAGRRAKLMDFGIARVAGVPTLTASGEVVGTLAYMSPEQAEGLVAGPESDGYSLGLTLLECWAGANPVAAATPAETARRIGEPHPRLSEYRPDLPDTLAETVDACLDAEPARRPSPLELGATLEASIPALDASRSVPLPAGEDRGSEAIGVALGLRRVVAVVALAGALALLAGPAELPGLALVLAALVLPAVILLPARVAAITPTGGLLGSLSLAGACPAIAGAAADSPGSRAVAGALTWCWSLATAVALGAGPRLGIAPRASEGWESSAGEAAASVLGPMTEPAALLGLASFALGAVALGWILTARHLAVAALGGLLWAAALGAALGAVGNGELGERPLLLALGVGIALALEGVRRAPRLARTLAASQDRRISFP
jgi:eukaryotic-like serine/threonine-protein kinase